ncbi:Uncharacterised protein [uncultured archaeon]|nr:Uncharacterised protein [uncultured archaeon]
MIVSGFLDILPSEHTGRDHCDIVPEALVEKPVSICPGKIEIPIHVVELEVLGTSQPLLIEDHIRHVVETTNVRLFELASKLQFPHS